MSEPSNLPWILGAILFIAYFGIVERYAFNHKDRTNSLSRALFNLSLRFPLSIMLFGALIGGVAVHIFWHWCPPGSNSFGFLMNHFDLG